MHARRTIRLASGAPFVRTVGALLLSAGALLAARSATAQGPVLPPTPDQNARRPPMSSPNVLTPEQILKAIGTFPPPQPAAAAPEVQVDVVNQRPAGEALPPPNPFDMPAAAARKDLVIPANPGDPEKVVIKESEGQVSLMVRDGSLRQVVAMVAETQKLNIVFAGNNDTLVTASFDRQPWQVVLDSLLSASGHTWTTQDDVIFISSIQNADFLPPGAGGRKVMVFELDFASAADIDVGVQGLLSPAGKSWITETNSADNRRTREIVSVVDYPPNLDRISEYISQTDQPPRQVYIEARILQVELSDECRNGVNFENLSRWGGTANINIRSVGFANDGASPSFFIEPDGVGLDGLVELLQATQDVKTLATPKIHTVSGQESHIQIGEKLGYRVTTTTQTSSLESVQMLEVGVVLRVTPRVTRDGRVLMRILPKVSTGSVDATTGLPSEDTTEVETDVLLCSGQGMVLGGLIQETDSNVQTKIPFLGDIPYAGVLFQRRTIVKSRREIIVTLQPHVLPYSPIVQEEHDQQFMRTVDPLTQGAIYSFPRPYEPSMPDALDKTKRADWLPCHWHEAPCDPHLSALPPVAPEVTLANPAAKGVSVLPASHEEAEQPASATLVR